MEARASVCIFLKAPRPGYVKTRLAAAVGEEGAAALARAFFDDTLALVRRLDRARIVLVIDGEIDTASFSDLEVWDQGEGDLGERLERGLRRALETTPMAIAIGTDAPALTLELLEEARTMLEHQEAVIGPSTDGGFYLLGLRRCPRGLLAELPWSTSETGACTLRRLNKHGLRAARLEESFDVDRPEDLTHLRELLERGELDAPHTAQVLRDLPECPTQPSASLSISVVMPVLDEERYLEQQLRHVHALPGIAEILVVDGGSSDRTLEIARSSSGVRVCSAPRGRGTQMNVGARAAKGNVLLFLHADVVLPENAAVMVERALSDSSIVAGAFRTRTVPDEEHRGWTWFLRFADVRSRFTNLPYGDQALFVRRDAFFAVGGFPNEALMEDLEL